MASFGGSRRRSMASQLACACRVALLAWCTASCTTWGLPVPLTGAVPEPRNRLLIVLRDSTGYDVRNARNIGDSVIGTVLDRGVDERRAAVAQADIVRVHQRVFSPGRTLGLVIGLAIGAVIASSVAFALAVAGDPNY
jgi:hypothetical protein